MLMPPWLAYILFLSYISCNVAVSFSLQVSCYFCSFTNTSVDSQRLLRWNKSCEVWVMLPPVNVGRFLRLCPECWTRGECVAGRDLLALLCVESCSALPSTQLRVSEGTHSALCNTVIAPCAFFSSKYLWNIVITRVFGHTGSELLTFELFHPQPQCKVEAGCKLILVFLAGSKPPFL